MIRKIAVWYRNYFGFSKTETRGSVGLMILMILVVVIYGFSRKSLFSTPYNRVEDSVLLEQFHLLLEENILVDRPADPHPGNVKPLQFFDPNTVTYDWLVERGIAKRIASTWVNYLKKGGQFRVKEDILKIYGFTDSLFQVLDPLIKFAAKQIPAIIKQQPRDALIDINMADTTQLKSIRGIGSKLSARIVSFRDRLGGFISMKQLYEVYYLDSSVVELTMKKFFISPEFIPRKIYINDISEENLAKHPYVSNKEAKLVISYREQHGDFSTSEQLLNIPIISVEKLGKLEPYIGIVDQ